MKNLQEEDLGTGEAIVKFELRSDKVKYVMHQNHTWASNVPVGNSSDDFTLTLVGTPLALGSPKVKDGKSNKTSPLAGLRSASSSRSARIREFQATTVYQLHKGEHGTTRVVVVCRIEEGIDNAREAKSGKCGLGRGGCKGVFGFAKSYPIISPSIIPLPLHPQRSAQTALLRPTQGSVRQVRPFRGGR